MKIHPVQITTPLPSKIASLAEIARDSWYSWTPEVAALLARIDPVAWAAAEGRPAAALSRLDRAAAEAAAEDPAIVSEVAMLEAALASERGRDPADEMLVAYFSCEFGLDQGLPIYSGGLGLLAGDHLKAASNLGVPLVGVGLFYREGYFRQDLDATGWQVERYPANVPDDLPVVPELGPDGAPVTVRMDLAGETVLARIWRARAGSVLLYLLDTDVPENAPGGRAICDRLYGGDREHRIRQELVLGVGGVRALDALGVRPTVFHMNEGHSAFLSIERQRALMRAHGLSFEEALEVTRASTVFTTHTPVPAGNEVFENDLAIRYLAPLVAELGIDWARYARLGSIPGGDDQRLGMTVLALQTAGRANGVSRLHGEVSRAMWSGIWPGRLPGEIPIGSVTNGVHTQSWLGPEIRSALDGLGLDEVLADPASPDAWRGVAGIADHDLWQARGRGRARLVELANRRGGGRLDPNVLTIGFSRRFASYKRAGLLLAQMDRLLALLGDPDRPLQLVISGKAHPADDPGKAVMQEVVRVARDPRALGRVVFVPDYDIETAKVLVQGADVWLNTPRRPHEASGTSGMKAALNGVLNLSILDGWWPEGYDAALGWAIGSEQVLADTAAQDALDGDSLYRLLEDEVVPSFYDRGADGVPVGWVGRMRACILALGPQFASQRMVAEYAEGYYRPAHADGVSAARDGFAEARQVAASRARIESGWGEVAIRSLPPTPRVEAGAPLVIEADVTLGSLSPADVRVEALLGTIDGPGRLLDGAVLELAPVPGSPGRYRAEHRPSRSGPHGIALRVLPAAPIDRSAPHLVALEA